MKKNVGGFDKTIRFVIGIVLALVGFFVHISTGLRIGVFAVAAIALVTAFTGF
jgi:Inner membrane protein YgaP-like, transmembrane domain